MSTRVKNCSHQKSNVDEGESKLIIVKILFFATGFLLTYENLFGVFDDVKLRLLSVLIGGSLMFLGCKDTIELLIEECLLPSFIERSNQRKSQERIRCSSPETFTLQTMNGIPRSRRNNYGKTTIDDDTESTQINSFDTDFDIRNSKHVVLL